ncbi:hypothetical protein PRZ48_007450 [Zasmidium cellare]|uniref:Uncharacterized protein n=1 Tax=Zasmidium cellare TaxID=395010 RepID=A0ABR0EK35_ZASCE|nr:hypothetical protein PRZ48_007450 [Zasmidium cellare]
MRLLNVSTLSLEKFDPDSIPRYVIASHRWTKGQEASFEDVKNVQNVDKSGYKKILGLAKYVREHLPDVEWLWIDTCCIDDRHSQEVSEAINSMFRWYSRAELCLAYLADVETTETEDFIQSEWFSRGWTLQELLAPKTVVFLSSRWEVIGHKRDEANTLGHLQLEMGRSLEKTIASVTKIPVAILKDYELSKGLSVDVKQAWTSGRRTTREEDMYYCMFGIFDVAPGANYGEGLQSAKRRLMNAINERSREDDVARQARAGAANSNPSRQTAGSLTQEVTFKLVGSLYFPQMEDRRDHIPMAYQGTYRWALLSTSNTNMRWDNFVSWLQDPQPRSRTYWVSAKPGAGKSSLVRFLDKSLRLDQHMQPWAEEKVFRLRYYFWNPGSPLQKSLIGLLRTFLYQLYEQSEELLLSCIPLRKRIEVTSAANVQDLNWSMIELKETFRKFVSQSPSSARFLILVDGLDEIDGDEDSRDELVEFLSGLSSSPNIKMCVSSRRWTVFEDAFARCPQLRLEDLNSRDIHTYVRGQLMEQPRYEQMLTYEPSAAHLIDHVIRKAQGVFLWTRLVVKELTRGIRDGDNYHTLCEKLESMPDDLNAYFARLIDSIEPYHRREACILLQIALHDERAFTTLHPLRLIDLMFIQEADHDFALTATRQAYVQNFLNAEELLSRLDSTLRRISSLCKGLLECFFHGGSTLEDFSIKQDVPGVEIAMQWSYANWTGKRFSPRSVANLPRTLLPVLETHKYTAFDFRIDFMHRSLRDYLLEPPMLQFLSQHAGGHFDARNYLRNARLVEMFMASSAGLHDGLTLGLASYYISTLSVPSFRNDPRCIEHVKTFQPLVASYEERGATDTAQFWYICQSLRTWYRERSNFYTLIIDFALTGYLVQTLTTDIIANKDGRPMLDYALRPRFADFFYFGDVSIGLQYPDPNLVRAILALGADPNESHEGISIWPLFLNFVAEQETLREPGKNPPTDIQNARAAYFFTLASMIQSGAHTVLSRADLSVHFMYGMFSTSTRDQSNSFEHRWPGLLSKAQPDEDDMDTFALFDVLDCLRPMFGDNIDRLKQSIQTQDLIRQLGLSQ